MPVNNPASMYDLSRTGAGTFSRAALDQQQSAAKPTPINIRAIMPALMSTAIPVPAIRQFLASILHTPRSPSPAGAFTLGRQGVRQGVDTLTNMVPALDWLRSLASYATRKGRLSKDYRLALSRDDAPSFTGAEWFNALLAPTVAAAAALRNVRQPATMVREMGRNLVSWPKGLPAKSWMRHVVRSGLTKWNPLLSLAGTQMPGYDSVNDPSPISTLYRHGPGAWGRQMYARGAKRMMLESDPVLAKALTGGNLGVGEGLRLAGVLGLRMLGDPAAFALQEAPVIGNQMGMAVRDLMAPTKPQRSPLTPGFDTDRAAAARWLLDAIRPPANDRLAGARRSPAELMQLRPNLAPLIRSLQKRPLPLRDWQIRDFENLYSHLDRNISPTGGLAAKLRQIPATNRDQFTALTGTPGTWYDAGR